jgi:plastocyanin
MTRSSISLLAVAAAAVLAAGCGSSGSSSSSSGGGGGGYGGGNAPAKTTTTAGGAPAASTSGNALAFSADESGGLAFVPKTMNAKSGSVTLKMANPAGNSLPHAIAITGGGLSKAGATAQPGGTSTLTATLKPGTYTFYCPVDGHRAQGMEGQLSVS